MPRPRKTTSTSEPMFHAYGKEGPDKDISARCLEAAESVYHHTSAAPLSTPYCPSPSGRVYDRNEMTRRDFVMHRPSAAIPSEQKDVIALCDNLYYRVGLLRNIIDLMSDFASQGIEIFHPVKSKERMYRTWFRKVQGRERSERFLNLLYRHGNVVIKKSYADLNAGDIKDLEATSAARPPATPADIEYKRMTKVHHNRIPLQYTFMNPIDIELIGGDFALFAGLAGTPQKFGLKLPQNIINLIKNPKDDQEELANLLPPWVVNPVRAGKKVIPLDPDKLKVYHYKKDDWMQWANPMIYSILADVQLYEKLKLADMAALDGAISHVCLWTLGSLEHKIQPGPAAFEKLAEQLRNNPGGGRMDLIWDATLDFKETSTDVQSFLGPEKYQPALQAIYAGLGIPQSLTGSGGSQGMTNNALSLKTLIERLQYGRDLLTEFWEGEMAIIQKAFGHKQPARIHYDNMTLSDEASEKMLWVQLYDRDIISVESIREKFGQIPEVEESRINREYKSRKEDTVPEKLGPFVEVAPNPDATAIKGMQTGLLAPSETKVKRQPKKAGDKSLQDHQDKQAEKQFELDKQRHEMEMQFKREEQDVKLKFKEEESKVRLQQKKKQGEQALKQKGQPGQGRPRNSKDTTKRKTRTPKPRTAANVFELQVFARDMQKKIADIVNPAYLESVKKKNLRSLTTAEADELEWIKSGILFSTTPGEDLPADAKELISRASVLGGRSEADVLVKELVDHAYGSRGKVPTLDELREAHATAYAMTYSRDDDD